MITLTHLNDFTFTANDDQAHKVIIDGTSQSAPCPTDLLLMALASCCSTDVVALIKEQNGILEKLTLDTEETLRETEPRIFTAIKLNFQIQAKNIGESQIHQIIQMALSKHCHVCIMLGSSIDLSYSLKLIG